MPVIGGIILALILDMPTLFKLKFKATSYLVWSALLLGMSSTQAQVLVMVHPSFDFQSNAVNLVKRGSETVQPAADNLVNHFLSKNRSVYVLAVHTGESYTSYLSGLDKTIIVPSQGGENHLKLADRHIYMAGGMMDFCFKRALKDVLEMNAHSSEPLYVHLVEPAIYNKRFNNKRPEEIQEKFKEFINDVTDSGKTLQGYESLVTIDVILNTTPLE